MNNEKLRSGSGVGIHAMLLAVRDFREENFHASFKLR